MKGKDFEDAMRDYQYLVKRIVRLKNMDDATASTALWTCIDNLGAHGDQPAALAAINHCWAMMPGPGQKL